MKKNLSGPGILEAAGTRSALGQPSKVVPYGRPCPSGYVPTEGPNGKVFKVCMPSTGGRLVYSHFGRFF